MPVINLKTQIKASQKLVFDLSRSIDLHVESVKYTQEQAVYGTVNGLIEKGELVTFRAKHFFIWQRLTSKITEFDAPDFFVDEMQEGIFKSLRHEHYFKKNHDGTEMIDVFKYESPFGFLGKLADVLFLKIYLKNLLKRRNKVIKKYAETDKWKTILGPAY